MEKIASRYRTLFSIEEIERSTILQWSFGAMVLFFFLSFSAFISNATTSIEAVQRGTAVCWPYFQSCSSLFTLSALPYGYTQGEFYMVLYAVMLFIVYLMWKKEWVHAHFLVTLLWLWKIAVVFIFSYLIAGPFDYYHLIFTAILLFIPFKEYFLKVMFVLLYFMSVTTKFDSTWVLGTYFTAMKTGLPLFPTSLAPVFTNIVIFSQIIGCWFLLSKNVVRQRIALAFFVFFHLYSGILVRYQYPTITLPPLLILFGPMYRHTPTPFSRKALWGVLIIIAVLLFQLLGNVISPDRRMTLEGNRFGMFMFEANHQCIATVRTYTRDTKVASSTTNSLTCSSFYCVTQTKTYMSGNEAVREDRYESVVAPDRCDPYSWWVDLNTRCSKNTSISHIAFQFDHEINGGPFYRIIDVPNICDLDYKPFTHNSWILVPPAAKIVGYPVENYY